MSDEDEDEDEEATTATAAAAASSSSRKNKKHKSHRLASDDEDDDDDNNEEDEHNNNNNESLSHSDRSNESSSDNEEDNESSDSDNEDEEDEEDQDMSGLACTSAQASSSRRKRRREMRRKNKQHNKLASKDRRSKTHPTTTTTSTTTTTTSTKTSSELKECPKEYRPPEWLVCTKARKTPYVPQIGDDVMYFRQGHELYAEAVRTHNVYEMDKDPVPAHVSVREHCRVVDLKIQIGVPRLVCLTLAVVDAKSGQSSGDKFKVKFHDMPNVVDFVVLRQFYERGIERHWKPKDRFKCLIDDLWYVGVVEAHLPYQDEHPECEFQSLRIVWDTGEEEPMSPWDLEPLSGTRKSKPISTAAAHDLLSEPQPVTAEEIGALLYVPIESEWPPNGRDEECDRILQVIQFFSIYFNFI